MAEVFISYARTDQGFARDLHDALKNLKRDTCRKSARDLSTGAPGIHPLISLPLGSKHAVCLRKALCVVV